MAVGGNAAQRPVANGSVLSYRGAFWTAALRFTARVVSGLLVAYSATALVGYESRLAREERRFDFPLWVAFDQLGIAAIETHLSARAAVEAGGRPSMARLKELAAKAAGNAAAGAALWSDAGTGYRAVYYEGGDPSGGVWLVSSSYIESAGGEGGRVDLATSRSVYGKVDDVRNALYALRRKLERGAERPLFPEYQLRATGRPQAGANPEELARKLLDALGVGAATFEFAEGELIAYGYSPRLPGRAERAGAPVNVVVRVTERGLGPWIEVGSPTL